MIIASFLSYVINEAVQTARYKDATKMNFEAPLTALVWLTSLVSVAMTFIVSYLIIPDLGDGTLLVEALGDHHLRHPGRGDHPRGGQGLHLHRVRATFARWSPPRARAARR